MAGHNNIEEQVDADTGSRLRNRSAPDRLRSFKRVVLALLAALFGAAAGTSCILRRVERGGRDPSPDGSSVWG